MSLPEFLGVLGVLRRTATPPPDVETLEEALKLLEQTAEPSLAGDEWNLYKAFWLGEEGEERGEDAESKRYVVADARERDEAKLRYEYDEPTPPRALIAHDFPISEQLEGSCVAHAVAAILEFLTGEPCDETVVQILYQAARDRDGIRAPDGGTGLRPTISWLQDGPKDQRLWSAGLLCLNEGDVYTMKRTLIGSADRRPSPIVAAFTHFGSSTESVAGRLSGKWTLPIGGEAPGAFCAAFARVGNGS